MIILIEEGYQKYLKAAAAKFHGWGVELTPEQLWEWLIGQTQNFEMAHDLIEACFFFESQLETLLHHYRHWKQVQALLGDGDTPNKLRAAARVLTDVADQFDSGNESLEGLEVVREILAE